MKKIVGILAVASVAASLFAADVSAKVKLDGSLFNYDGTNEEAKAVSIGHNTDESWNPVMAMSVNSDNAGAETSVYVGKYDATSMGGWNHGYGIGIKTWKIWFKPLDVLTVRVGSIAESMNTEMIDWSNRTVNYDDYGYEVAYSQDALTIAASLVTGTGVLFESDKVAKDAIYNAAGANTDKEKEAALKANEEEAKTKQWVDTPAAKVGHINLFGQYGADFGTLKFMFDTNNTFKSNKIAVGYNNNFDGLTFFADAAVTIDQVKRTSTKDGKVATQTDLGLIADAYAAYSVDALTIRGYVRGTVKQLNNISKDYYNAAAKAENSTGYTNSKGDVYNVGTLPNNIAVMLIARADYKLDAVNVFAYFKSENLLQKAVTEDKDGKKSDDPKSVFVSTIRAGMNGSVGIANWEGYLQLETGKGKGYDKVNVSVPVNFTVNF